MRPLTASRHFSAADLPFLLAMLLGAVPALFPQSSTAQSVLKAFSVAGGGGASTGGVYSAVATSGQFDAGFLAGGLFSVAGGFWGVAETNCLGFGCDGPWSSVACLSLVDFPLGPVPNPWLLEGVKLLATRMDGTSADTRIDHTETFPGYWVEYRADLEFQTPCQRVTIDFFQQSSLVEFVAYDDEGAEIVSPRPTFSGVTGLPQTAALESGSSPIRRVIVTSPNARLNLRRICCANEINPTPLGPYTPLGQATLTATAEGGLAIGNLVAGGGLRIDLEGKRRLTVEFDRDLPANQTPSGATFDLVARGVMGEALGRIHSLDTGDFYRTTVDFNALNSPTYRLDVYASNQLVASYPELSGALLLPGQPATVEIEATDEGQLSVLYAWPSLQTFEIENAVPVDGATPALAIVGQIQGSRLRFITVRNNQNVIPLRGADFYWSAILGRFVHIPPSQCVRIIVPDPIHIPCAPYSGSTVHFTVTASNRCTGAVEPVLDCTPRSGTVFPIGCRAVTCIFTPPGQPALFSSFQVCVTDRCNVENPSFEMVDAPPPPAGGRAFAGVTAWSVLEGEAHIFGPGGGFAAHSGNDYAGLDIRIATGGIEGRLVRPIEPVASMRRRYEVSGWFAYRGDSSATVELSLADSATGRKTVAGSMIIQGPPRWGWFVGFATPSHRIDRVQVNTTSRGTSGSSESYVYVDDVTVCCVSTMTTGPCDDALSRGEDCMELRWAGRGTPQITTSFGVNPVWEDLKLPVKHHLDQHRVAVPISSNAPTMFFRLRLE